MIYFYECLNPYSNGMMIEPFKCGHQNEPKLS